MKAIKVEFIMQDDLLTSKFLREELPELRVHHNLKQVHYHKCEYFEK